MLDFTSLLPLLRLQQLQQPPGMTGVDSNQDDNPDPNIEGNPVNFSNPSDYDASKRMSELYHPSTSAMDRYNSQFSNMPNPNNFQPSIGRRILGGMAALTNPEVGEHIVRQPYDLARETFNSNIKPLHDAADLEYRSNTNQRILANDTISREIGDRRNEIATKESDRKEKEGQQKNAREEERIKIQQDRAKAYEWSKTHPNYDGRIDKDGKLVYVNKTDPSDIVHTNIDTGKMNDFEKIQANIKGRLSEIAAQGANASGLEDKKNTNRIGQIDEAARVKPPVVGKTTSTTTTIAPDAKSKTVTSTTTPNPASTTTNRGVTPGGSPTSNMNSNTDEMVSVVNPQGNRVKIKKSQLADALKAGYKQVQ